MFKPGREEDNRFILIVTVRIVCVYVLVAWAWIYFSDLLLEYFVSSQETLSRFQTIKGFLFVLVTGIFLFFYVYRVLKRRSIMEKSYRDKLNQGYVKLQKTLESAIGSISRILEIKDPYTQGHQKRVAALAVSIAEKMGLGQEDVECIRISAMIHDIGKISLSSDLLTRPGELSEIEHKMIRTHPGIGKDIVKEMDFPCPVAEIISQHHERMDGSGYPEGLKGEQIHLFARIIAVADVVEAMSFHRPYHPAAGLEKALETIAMEKGSHFDPQVVDTCIDLFRKDGFILEKEDIGEYSDPSQ